MKSYVYYSPDLDKFDIICIKADSYKNYHPMFGYQTEVYYFIGEL